MDDQNKNLLLATALSFLVILVWYAFIDPPEVPVEPDPAVATESGTSSGPDIATIPDTAGAAAVPSNEASETPEPVDAERVTIETPKLSGSINLAGGRIDDLSLNTYRETIDPDAEIVRLLNPVGEPEAYYVLYGWAPGGDLTSEDVPGPSTIWTVESGSELTSTSPVTLRWDSPAGLIFRRTISVDEDYLFNIEQSVENLGDAAVQAAPYGIIAQHGRPARLENFFIAHEGVIGQLTDELLIKKYNALEDLELDPVLRTNGETYADVQGGWVGLTDKYFMSTLVPPATQQFDVDVLFQPRSEIYQVRTRYPAVQVAPGATVSAASQMFAGAKEWELIRTYQDEGGIRKFIDSIDWGWFYFLTKPIFAVLHWLNLLLGNMGWAILGLTLLIKALLFPLAYKSYVSMAKMKELQPEMEKIKERVGDDRQKMQQEMMALYKDKKVNPAAGCLPILLQIPIFFSLYKVIFVTLELRHAPWLGPFQDLSAPDPTSFLNLFGLLPFGGPEPGSIVGLIFIGILPLLLGISMWLQQKLNPAPTDPTQAAVFAWMPWIFMFMLGGFASGLVIYWIANNVITFAQQYIIMRSNGYKPDLLGNITSSFKRKDTEAK